MIYFIVLILGVICSWTFFIIDVKKNGNTEPDNALSLAGYISLALLLSAVLFYSSVGLACKYKYSDAKYDSLRIEIALRDNLEHVDDTGKYFSYMHIIKEANEFNARILKIEARGHNYFFNWYADKELVENAQSLLIDVEYYELEYRKIKGLNSDGGKNGN